MIILITRLVFVRFLSELKVKVTFPPFHTILFGRKSLCKPILKEWGVSTYIIWNFSVWGICLFSPVYVFIYSVIHLYQYGLMNIYSLVYNPILLYFVAQTVPTLVSGSSFSWLFCPFDILPIIVIFRFSTSLFCGSRCSKLTLCIYCPSPRLSHFPKES